MLKMGYRKRVIITVAFYEASRARVLCTQE